VRDLLLQLNISKSQIIECLSSNHVCEHISNAIISDSE